MTLRSPRALGALLALAFLARPAAATWSIVMVDTATGEVAVGAATCLSANLKRLLPVVLVGVGGGAAQSAVDLNGFNRKLMRQGLDDGLSPQEILDELVFGAGTSPGQRQYGIAAMTGPAVTWTGGQSGFARGGVTGQVGTIRYAIQGNVLANDEVLGVAELAVRSTPGDLGQKLMAGMKAAARLGGDGRCSCAGAPPCGPPPHGFELSALSGFVIVARIGDNDSGCSAAGCANAKYYLSLNEQGTSMQDPVRELETRYAAWRDEKRGRPDHILSTVRASADRLLADGESTVLVSVRLVDLNGTPLEHGGASIGVTSAAANPLTTVGPIVDHADGSYSFLVRAGTSAGTDELVITADDGTVAATLHPPLVLEVIAPPARVPPARRQRTR